MNKIIICTGLHPKDQSAPGNVGVDTGNAHVQEVVRQAHEQLRLLMRRRDEVVKRIGTVKRVIAGLANLFGDVSEKRPD
jgi:hypothetical protein